MPPAQPSLQLPEQSLSQHTFVAAPGAVAAQWPLPHSVSDEHASLFARALHWPLMHAGMFFGQSVSPQQVVLGMQVCVPRQFL